ncbi:hypothetical protein AAY473_001548 [Plecturocebus cupreus]
MPFEYCPIKVQVLFSLQDLRKIKRSLGKFSDDHDKYIEAFQNSTRVFEVSWKDIMLLWKRTLTTTEKQAFLKNEISLTQLEEQKYHYRTGSDENPSAFLERLREALIKHTSLSADSVDGQLILKSKFIAQVATYIRRKLQKLAMEPDSTLDNLLKVITLVFCNRDGEEALDRGDARKRQRL